MTLSMMKRWGATWRQAEDGYIFDAESCANFGGISEYDIEPDASAASYFFAAAAITGGRVALLELPEHSLQGDTRFVEVLAEMGCRIEKCNAGITVHGRPLRGISVDMNDISDCVMSLAAVACFADGPTTIRNVAHIRHKETDRLAALATELRRVGAEIEEFADGLRQLAQRVQWERVKKSKHGPKKPPPKKPSASRRRHVSTARELQKIQSG